MRSKEKKVLILIFDFRDWPNAKSWSYVSGFLLADEAEALYGDDAVIQVIPYHYDTDQINRLLIAFERSYSVDSTLIFLPHNHYDKSSLEIIDRFSNSIQFICVESLLYSAKEISELPHLARRFDECTTLIADYPVHCLCPETHNALLRHGYNSTFHFGFLPHATPSPDVLGKKDEPKSAAFASVQYNDERRTLKELVDNALRENKIDAVNLEDDLENIAEFEMASLALEQIDKNRSSYHHHFVLQRSEICTQIKNIRRSIWSEFVENLSATTFTMSLPSYFKGLPGRAAEAHLAGSIIVFVNTKFSESFKNSLVRCEGLVFVDGETLPKELSTAKSKSRFSNQQKIYTRASDFVSLCQQAAQNTNNPSRKRTASNDKSYFDVNPFSQIQVAPKNRRLNLTFLNSSLINQQQLRFGDGEFGIVVVEHGADNLLSLSITNLLENQIITRMAPLGDIHFLSLVSDQFAKLFVEDWCLSLHIVGGRASVCLPQYYYLKSLVKLTGGIVAITELHEDPTEVSILENLRDPNFDGISHQFRETHFNGLQAVIEV